jgi:hypothetical protein
VVGACLFEADYVKDAIVCQCLRPYRQGPVNVHQGQRPPKKAFAFKPPAVLHKFLPLFSRGKVIPGRKHGGAHEERPTHHDRLYRRHGHAVRVSQADRRSHKDVTALLGTLKEQLLVIEVEGAMYTIPYNNVKYIRVSPCPDKLPETAITGARLRE